MTRLYFSFLWLFLMLPLSLDAQDIEPNNGPEEANPIQLNKEIPGMISDADENDWYSFTINESGLLKIDISKTGIGVFRLRLKDGEQEMNPQVTFVTVAEADTSVSLSHYVGAGKYLIHLQQSLYEDIPYRFSVSLQPSQYGDDQEPNNTSEDATSIVMGGTLGSAIGYYNSGQGIDDEDWFRLELEETGNLTVNVLKSGNEFRVRLRDGVKEGNPIIHSINIPDGDNQYVLEQKITSGIYFVQIVQVLEEIADYQLSLSLIPSTYGNDDAPNEEIDEATPIQSGTVVNGTLGYYKAGTGQDENDWFSLIITETVLLNLQLNKTGQEANVRLRDGELSGNAILSEFNLSDAETFEELSYPLLPGNYLIQIRQILDEVIDYSMMILEAPARYGPDPEPNDDQSMAVEVIHGNSVSGTMGYYQAGVGNDEADWYGIHLEESGLLTLSTEKTSTGRFYIRFRNEDGQIERIFLNYEDTTSVSEFVIDSGQYYIFIDQSVGFSDYRIATTFRPRPIAGFEIDQVDNTVVFSSTSVDATGYLWDFGDGVTSTATHPMHIFATPGVFSVCLTVDNPGGEDQVCDTVTVEGLASVYPDRAGNTGDATLTVYGGGLDEESIIRIMDGGTIILEKDTIFSPGVDAIAARFNLRGQNMGVYDIEVQNGTGAIYKLEEAFTIESGTLPDPWVKVTGRTRYLRNVPTAFKLQVGNNGNVDATMVPVWIAVSDVEGLEIDFEGFNLYEPSDDLDSLVKFSEAEIPYTSVDTVFGKPFKSRVYPLIFPVVAPYSAFEINFEIKGDENVRFETWTNQPFFSSPYNEFLSFCQAAIMTEIISNVLPNELTEDEVFCVWKSYQEVYEKAFNALEKDPEELNRSTTEAFDAILDNRTLFHVVQNCNLGFIDKILDEQFVYMIHPLIRSQLKKVSDENDDPWTICFGDPDQCGEVMSLDGSNPRKVEQCTISGPRSPLNSNSHSARPVSSFDPNEKAGITGSGDENFLNFQKTLPYTVYFENVDSASAPAHIVRVIDTLDMMRYDLSSFQFGSVTIADTTVYAEKGQFKMLQDISLPSLNVVARVKGEIDTASGVVIWEFRSLDPVTLTDIEDPDVGFLPPNKMKPEGEGNVSYTIDVKDGLVNGDEIANKALIYFDANEPIITNTHMITLDTELPESRVMPLEPESTDTSFLVEWVGTDDQSGVKSYDVFVSVNEGSFRRWLVQTEGTSEIFVGRPDSTYSFFSLAYDYVGNHEGLPERADATISIISTGVKDVAHVVHPVKVYPNPAKESIFFVIEKGEGRSIQLLNNMGMMLRHRQFMDQRSLEMKVPDLPAGIYYWQIIGDKHDILNSGKVIIE